MSEAKHVAAPQGEARPRLVHLTWRLSITGGIPRFARDLLSGLDPERFEIHSVTVRPCWPEDRLDELGADVTLHALDVAGAPGIRGRLAAFFRFRRLLAGLRADILHTHDGTAWLGLAALSVRQRVPVRVLQIHDPPQARRVSRAATLVQRIMIRHLGFHPVVDTEPIRDQLAEAFRLPSERISVLPLGVDVEALSQPPVDRERWLKRHDLPTDRPLVLYVARLVESKNVELFLEVARTLLERGIEATFAVIGDGPRRQSLEASLAGFPERHRVRFLGFREDLVSAYHACDLFLSTSHAEGFGLAVAEAMAAGRPVVATAVGGVRQLVTAGSGLLCPPGDLHALADATDALLADPARRRRLGAAALAHAVEELSLSAMSGRYTDLFERLVRQRASAPTAGRRR